MTDNSHMFVDETKEDISEAGGIKQKGESVDETISGEITDESTFNKVVSDKTEYSDSLKEKIKSIKESKELSFQEKLEKRANELQEKIDKLEAEEAQNSIANLKEDNKSSKIIGLSNEKTNTINKGFGIASIVCGILSVTFFCSFINIFTSILGIIFGVVQIRRKEAKYMGIIGIILCILSVVIMVVCINLVSQNNDFVNMISNAYFGMNILTNMQN